MPYYLIEDYQDKKYKIDKKRDGKIVRAFHIYTRVVDNNTPINQSADIDDVEQLWKKRFGLLQTPLEQVKTLLNRPNEWQEENSCYYHSLFPQYTIRIEWDADQDDYDCFEENPEFYHFCQIKQSAHYGVLKIYHYGTQMYSCQVTELDGFRLCIPCPEWGYIDQPRYDLSITYKYYLKSSLLYSLLLFLVYKYNSMNGGEADNAVNRLLKVVLLFEDEYAANYFKLCVIEKHDLYIDLYNKEKEPYIETDSELVAKQEKKRIRDSLVLKKIQALIENG